MSEKTLSDLLERAADKTPVGAPPIGLMLQRGGQSRRRERATWGFALASAVAVVVVGIIGQGNGDGGSEQGPPPAEPSSVDIRLHGGWVVASFVDLEGRSLLPDAYDSPLLNFKDGTLTGTTGCNRFGGPFERSGKQGQNLRFGLMESTAIGCPDEPPLLQALGDVRRVTGSGDVLYLETQDGTRIIELHRVKSISSDTEPWLVGIDLEGTWTVSALVDSQGESLLTDVYESPQLTFTDGTLNGTTGCNGLGGRYEQSGERGENLVLPDVITTHMRCQGEPPLSQRLADVRHVSMADEDGQSVLQLHQEDWMIVAVLRPVAEAEGAAPNSTPGADLAELAGRWELIDAVINGIEVPITERDDLPVLSLRESLTGVATAGCRVVGVVLTAESGRLHLEVKGSPKALSCFVQPSDPTDGRYFDALPEVDRAEVHSNQMTLAGPNAELHFRAQQAQ